MDASDGEAVPSDDDEASGDEGIVSAKQSAVSDGEKSATVAKESRPPMYVFVESGAAKAARTVAGPHGIKLSSPMASLAEVVSNPYALTAPPRTIEEEAEDKLREQAVKSAVELPPVMAHHYNMAPQL